MAAAQALLLLGAAVSVVLVSARLFPRSGYVNPWEIEYNLYFGKGKDIDISKMFLLPPMEELDSDDDVDKEESTSVLPPIDDPDFNMSARRLNPAESHLDQVYDDLKVKLMFQNFDSNMQMEKDLFQEFPERDTNEFIKKVDNVSHFINGRRDWYRSCWGRCYLGLFDEQDHGWANLFMENRKRVMVADLALAYLMQMRYKIIEALKIRFLVKNDKRYMLGYLFYRLRRLIYDMKKIQTANGLVENNQYQREMSKMVAMHRVYIALEVDIKDTIDHIQHIYLQHPDPTASFKMVKAPKPGDVKPKTTSPAGP